MKATVIHNNLFHVKTPRGASSPQIKIDILSIRHRLNIDFLRNKSILHRLLCLKVDVLTNF